MNDEVIEPIDVAHLYEVETALPSECVASSRSVCTIHHSTKCHRCRFHWPTKYDG